MRIGDSFRQRDGGAEFYISNIIPDMPLIQLVGKTTLTAKNSKLKQTITLNTNEFSNKIENGVWVKL